MRLLPLWRLTCSREAALPAGEAVGCGCVSTGCPLLVRMLVWSACLILLREAGGPASVQLLSKVRALGYRVCGPLRCQAQTDEGSQEEKTRH